MNMEEAAKMTRDLLGEGTGVRHPGSESSSSHLCWMLNGIIQGYIQNEKAHRWLGFVQGALVVRDLATVEDLKGINKGHIKIRNVSS